MGRYLGLATIRIAIIGLFITLSYQAAAQEVVLIIRHAERECCSADPEISDRGRARAEVWADVFAGTRLDVIVTSEMTRTRQTARPIAEALQIPTVMVSRYDEDALMHLLRSDYPNDRVLIVGHSGTIPSIIQRLGHPDRFYISDFDDLFVVTPGASSSASVLRLNVP